MQRLRIIQDKNTSSEEKGGGKYSLSLTYKDETMVLIILVV